MSPHPLSFLIARGTNVDAARASVTRAAVIIVRAQRKETDEEIKARREEENKRKEEAFNAWKRAKDAELLMTTTLLKERAHSARRSRPASAGDTTTLPRTAILTPTSCSIITRKFDDAKYSFHRQQVSVTRCAPFHDC
jgi:hypothetical protein